MKIKFLPCISWACGLLFAYHVIQDKNIKVNKNTTKKKTTQRKTRKWTKQKKGNDAKEKTRKIHQCLVFYCCCSCKEHVWQQSLTNASLRNDWPGDCEYVQGFGGKWVTMVKHTCIQLHLKHQTSTDTHTHSYVFLAQTHAITFEGSYYYT